MLPENPIADAAVAELRRFGVDISQIVRAKGRLGVYYLEAGANQRPSRIVYDRDDSAIALAKPGDISWARAFRGRFLVPHQRHHARHQRFRCGSGARIGTGMRARRVSPFPAISTIGRISGNGARPLAK